VQHTQGNHTQGNIDTSTQAMTEVALGLSMAFFSLLILALLSVGAGQSTQSTTNEVLSDKNHALYEQARLSVNQDTPDSASHQNHKESASYGEDLTFIFYKGGRYFDNNLGAINIEKISASEQIVLVLAPTLPLSQVMQVQADFTGKNIQVTQMNTEWSNALSQLPEGL